jgi:hypothetical protein
MDRIRKSQYAPSITDQRNIYRVTALVKNLLYDDRSNKAESSGIDYVQIPTHPAPILKHPRKSMYMITLQYS